MVASEYHNSKLYLLFLFINSPSQHRTITDTAMEKKEDLATLITHRPSEHGPNLADLPEEGNSSFGTFFLHFITFYISPLFIVLVAIFSIFITPEDIFTLPQTCVRFKNIIEANEDKLWAKVCRNTYQILIPAAKGFAKKFYNNGRSLI